MRNGSRACPRRVDVLLLAVLICLWPAEADAYIDPGTGSMIIQVVFASIIGIGLFVRSVRVRLRSWVERAKRTMSRSGGRP